MARSAKLGVRCNRQPVGAAPASSPSRLAGRSPRPSGPRLTRAFSLSALRGPPLASDAGSSGPAAPLANVQVVRCGPHRKLLAGAARTGCRLQRNRPTGQRRKL